jgi:hypothetical protein
MSTKKEKSTTSADKAKSIQKAFPNGFETMTIKATKQHKYAKEGDEIEVSKTVGEDLIKRGWAKAATIILLLMLALVGSVNAQAVRRAFFDTAIPSASTVTITNAGTGSVQNVTAINGGGTSTTIVAILVKTSGTIAGTLTLTGSLDGTNFKAISQEGIVTAVPTHTLVDGAGTTTYNWVLNGSPFRFYRVTAAGGTTVVYTLDVDLMKH